MRLMTLSCSKIIPQLVSNKGQGSISCFRKFDLATSRLISTVILSSNFFLLSKFTVVFIVKKNGYFTCKRIEKKRSTWFNNCERKRAKCGDENENWISIEFRDTESQTWKWKWELNFGKTSKQNRSKSSPESENILSQIPNQQPLRV